MGRRTVLAVWSTFRELSWWADNAGPMPRPFVVVVRVLGAAVVGVGLYVLFGSSAWVGAAMLLVGAGFLLGSFELKAVRERVLSEGQRRPEDRLLTDQELRTGWE